MKQLIFMRHAKANVDSMDGTDFSRELAQKGELEAQLMVEKLLKTKYEPTQIIASPAARTKKTASYFVEAFSLSRHQHSFEFGMYNAEFENLLEIINQVDDNVETLMMVGHNPSMHIIVAYLSNKFLPKMPTAGIVIVRFNEKTWKHIKKGSGEIVWSQDPKGGPLV